MSSPRLFALAACLGLAACTPFSLSPPARVLPLESSATLDEGTASVEVSGGVHEAVSHPSGFASVGLAYAPTAGVQLSVDGNYANVDYGDERSPHLGAGHVGLKIAPIPHLAFVAGVGAGSGTHGGFVSPDAGIIVGYENPYFVPWTALRGLASIPVDPVAVTVTRGGSNGELDMFTLIPPDTLGWQVSTGFRIPIRIDEQTQLDLLAGAGVTALYGLDDATGDHAFFTAAFGARMVVGP